jgi:hypothetical protein
MIPIYSTCDTSHYNRCVLICACSSLDGTAGIHRSIMTCNKMHLIISTHNQLNMHSLIGMHKFNRGLPRCKLYLLRNNYDWYAIYFKALIVSCRSYNNYLVIHSTRLWICKRLPVITLWYIDHCDYK